METVDAHQCRGGREAVIVNGVGPPLMLNVTTLLCGPALPSGAEQTTSVQKPQILWNITRRCNLHCLQCGSDSSIKSYPGELTLQQLVDVVDDIADYGVPAVHLAGGEPLLHPHFYDLAGYAVARGLRVSVSTNGTRIDSHAAERMKDLGISDVEISLDGVGEGHDLFRGRTGAFEKVVDAFRHCRGAGQNAGLRLSLRSDIISQLPELLRFIEEEEIAHVTFHHFLPAGRGAGYGLASSAETRRALRIIGEAAQRLHREESPIEIFTSNQPADGAFFWLTIGRRNPKRAEEIRQRLVKDGGLPAAAEGVNIDSQGDVHPDVFWRGTTLGNVKDLPFSKIWNSARKNEACFCLQDRSPRLKGRCAKCRFQEICGGGFRARAFEKSGDIWSEDPGCYLRDYEIAMS